MKFPSCSLLILGVFFCNAISLARALPESEATAGRLAARRYAEAIVQVKGTVVLNVKIGLRALPPSERKIDLCGTVIGASGMTVTSLSAVDPKSIFESMRSQMNTGADPVELGETEFRNMRLRMADGSEIPVKILWKDVEHDLVLLAPQSAAAGNRTFTFVDLNQAAESAAVLGTYYQLSRAGEELQRVLLVRASTVTGIIERPRRLLLISTDMYPDALGCPVFDADGRPLGISLHIMEKGLPKGTVLIPAADIAAAIAQASPD